MKLAIFLVFLFLTTVYSASLINEGEEFRMDQSKNLETERVLDLVTKTLEDVTKTVKGLLPL
nr:AMP3 [Heteropoda venatoria]